MNRKEALDIAIDAIQHLKKEINSVTEKTHQILQEVEKFDEACMKLREMKIEIFFGEIDAEIASLPNEVTGK